MKKVTGSLILISILIYLIISMEINIDFLIKCSIILVSLVIHKQGHIVMRVITKKLKYEKIRIILIGCGGLISNFIVFLIFKEIYNTFDFIYSGYIVVINFSLIIVNLLPIYPSDCFGVLTTMLKITMKEENVLKVANITSLITIVLIVVAGFIQMLLFSYNCSVIVTCLFLSKYKKYIENEVECVS